MILFNLHCAKKHEFEGWFPSGASFETQAVAGAIACPKCGDSNITKAPMAPRIGKSTGVSESEAVAAAAEMRRQLADLRTKVETNCDYVGPQFAEEARRIHYGEVDKRSIYGEASKEEAAALTEEGIEFGTIPWVPRDN